MNINLARRYLTYAAIVTVAVVVISLHARGLMKTTTYRHARITLTEAALMVQKLMLSQDLDDVDRFLKTSSPDKIRITLVDIDGTVLADSRKDIASLDNHLDREEIRTALEGRAGTSRRYSESLGRDMLYVALPVFQYNHSPVVVRAAMAEEDVSESIAGMYLRLIIAAIAVIVVISVIALFFETRMVGAIPSIQKAAQAYAAGELDYPLKIEKPQDLRLLAESLRQMADSLKGRMAEVTTQKNESQAVLSSMVEAVVIVDRDLKIRTMNPSACRLVNLPAEAAGGRGLLEVFNSMELCDFARSTLDRAQPQERSITLLAGRELYLQVHGTLLPQSPNSMEPSGALVLVFNDISKLELLERMRRDFVANVSHELKTPITSVKGYLETLIDGARDDPDMSERFLRIAVKHTDRLNAILEDLLSLSRLEQQEGSKLEFKICDLADIASGAIQVCTTKAARKNISLELSCSEPLEAEVDPLLIEQALINLIDNAIKYSDPASAVKVDMRRQGEQITVSVIDNGIGIPQKDLSRVFERFYRVDKARSRELGGTGLGLAIVKHIAIVHKGSVQVRSELGVGSTFTINLPRSGEES